jgi:3'-phosphoadenosine 5'-phosphosulfate sulfotransferase (PAPS reductase)/FAD synthetase
VAAKRAPIPGVDSPVPYLPDGTVAWPAADPDSPYFCKGPTQVSFSGGRTSGLLLFLILWAHGGVLPDYVIVVFANTGKEREETLRFVHDCATHWGVKIWWVERRWSRKLEGRFEIVGFNSASRNGEPFAELIRRKQYLPSPGMRYCTTELKVRPMKWFMQSRGFKRWDSIIGLRGDELRRVTRQLISNDKRKEVWTTVMPMATAAGGMVKQEHVQAFWKAQPFDLGIHSADGNCDLCFLKSRGSRARQIRQNPAAADWLIAMENVAKCSMSAHRGHGESNARFDATESMTQLRDSVLAQPLLDLGTPEDEDFDVECGLACATDAEVERGLQLNRGCGKQARAEEAQ